MDHHEDSILSHENLVVQNKPSNALMDLPGVYPCSPVIISRKQAQQEGIVYADSRLIDAALLTDEEGNLRPGASSVLVAHSFWDRCKEFCIRTGSSGMKDYLGKCIYRGVSTWSYSPKLLKDINLVFESLRCSKSAGASTEIRSAERLLARMTAEKITTRYTIVHVGEGVFISAAHCVSLPGEFKHLIDESQGCLPEMKNKIIWGAGDLDCERKRFGKKFREYSIELLGVSKSLQHSSDFRRYPTDQAFLFHAGSIAPEHDFAFFRLRSSKTEKPFKIDKFLLPTRLKQQKSVECTLAAISCRPADLELFISQYYQARLPRAVNYESLRHKIEVEMKPGMITLSPPGKATRAGFTARLSPETMLNTDMDEYCTSPVGALLRHRCQALSGASGGALLNEDYEMIGIHVSHEPGLVQYRQDPRYSTGVATTFVETPQNLNVGIIFGEDFTVSMKSIVLPKISPASALAQRISNLQ